MNDIILRPINVDKDYEEEIRKRIIKVLIEEIFDPLFEIIKHKHPINNAKSYLADAIRKGKIRFHRGSFVGKFSATTSREIMALGAAWDSRLNGFKIFKSNLPKELIDIIESSQSYFDKKLSAIDLAISKILPDKIASRIKIEDILDKTLWKVNKDFKESVKAVTITPKVTTDQDKMIVRDYQRNLELSIKGWSKQEIFDLRDQIRKAYFNGERYEKIADILQVKKGVSERKAMFWARQETHLLVAKYKEARYTENNITHYKWVCVHMPHDKSPKHHDLGNVRYSHGLLNGKIFRFDDPPIISNPGQPERRGNPGYDYNCRCVAHIVIKRGE